MKLYQMLCGSAFKNKGVQAMLDAVIDYYAYAVDVVEYRELSQVSHGCHASDDEPFAALGFKIMTDPFVGQLIFFRVYSGVVKAGDTFTIQLKVKKRRIGRILQMHANNREEIKEVRAGDIAAAVGLKDVTTGDTICDIKNPMILERMIFPEPVIHVLLNQRQKQTKKKWVLL